MTSRSALLLTEQLRGTKRVAQRLNSYNYRTEKQKESALGKVFNSTGGQWTKSASYDPATRVMTVEFQSGFVARYPNIDQSEADSFLRGATTKTGISGSVGAWIHQHPSVMHNYN